jgi:hypothetical protein
MTQETQNDSYRGVQCLHCEQPIPIPPLVASIEAEIHKIEATPLRHRKCQVFHLRCMACGKERPYQISEILLIEGMPSDGIPQVDPSSAHSHEVQSKFRVASA